MAQCLSDADVVAADQMEEKRHLRFTDEEGKTAEDEAAYQTLGSDCGSHNNTVQYVSTLES